MASTKIDSEISIVAGSTQPMRIEFIDESGAPEQIGAVDQAVVTFRTSVDAETWFLRFSTEDDPPTLEIHDSAAHKDADADPSYIRATIDQATADGLKSMVGTHVVTTSLRFGASDGWRSTAVMRAKILPNVSDLDGSESPP